MNERKLTELIHREIDGANSPEETRTLQGLISESPDAKRSYDELCALAHTLSGVEQVEAPPTLKPAIARAIEQRHAATARRPARARILEAVEGLTSGRKIAYAFSAGLLAGAALLFAGWSLAGMSGLDHNDVAGTLGAGERSMLVGTAEVVTVPLEDMRGTIRAEYSGRLRILTLKLSSAAPVQIQVSYDRAVLDLEGVRPTGEAEVDIFHTDAGVEVRGEGQIGLELYLTAQDEQVPPVSIAIASTEGRVYRGQVFLHD
jgi:hypothetical protein